LKKKSDYSLTSTLEIINDEINKIKMKVFALGIFFFLISMLLVPLSIFFLGLLLDYSDLPIIDSVNSDGLLFLVSYDVILIFYMFIVKSSKKSKHKQLPKNLYILIFMVILLSLLPLYISNLTAIIVLYMIFFSFTLFQISKYYYENSYEIPFLEGQSYKGGYGGMVDDPFTLEDDVNRAKFSLEGIFSIFSFIFFLYEQVVRSITFLYIIRDKKNLFESARLMTSLLNNNIEVQKINSNFSTSSKMILETIGYVIFENRRLLCEKAKIKFKME